MIDKKAGNEANNFEGILALIDSKFQQLQERLKKDQTVVLYQPGNLTKENRFVMLVRVEIEYALLQLVEAASKNPLSGQLDEGYAAYLAELENQSLIDDGLAQDIRDFFTFSTPFIRELMDSQLYLQLQYISSDILERIQQIPTDPA